MIVYGDNRFKDGGQLVNLEALGILLRIFTVDLERGAAGWTATGAGEEEATAGSIGAVDDGWVDVRLTGG